MGFVFMNRFEELVPVGEVAEILSTILRRLPKGRAVWVEKAKLGGGLTTVRATLNCKDKGGIPPTPSSQSDKGFYPGKKSNAAPMSFRGFGIRK
jgi:hypothetical protein